MADRPGRQRDRVQVPDHAGLDLLGDIVARPANLQDRAVFAVDRFVEPRDICPLHLAGDSRQLVGARQARALQVFPQVADDRQAWLAVADHEQIDKRRKQLRVLRAGPARDHQACHPDHGPRHASAMPPRSSMVSTFV